MTQDDLAAIEARANVEGLPSRADLHALVAEVRRLTCCLVTANATLERAERELYLRINDLEAENERLRSLVASHEGVLFALKP